MSSDYSARLTSKVTQASSVLQTIWQALRVRLCDTGIEDSLNLIPRPEKANYELRSDPVDGSETLVGIWKDKRGTPQGEIQIREDGRIYAEVDVIRDHPTDVRWFVESVVAWGSSDNLKTELRLLPAI